MRVSLSLLGVVCLFACIGAGLRPAGAAARPESVEITEGQLQVVASDGSPRGACPLEHTDVKADVSGFLARVTVTQKFVNPFDEAIEAVYLFNHANLYVSRSEADLSAGTYVPAYYDGRRQVQFGAKLVF